MDVRRERIRWYAYLHLFDYGGRYPRSEISLIGVGPYLGRELDRQADARLKDLLGELVEARFGDIAIRPFRLEHDGVTFGLIDESDDERGSWAEPYPSASASHGTGLVAPDDLAAPP